MHCSSLQTHRKRAPELITDGCEPPCGCWDLNSGPLEEQSLLLTSKPSLQPNPFSFLIFYYCPEIRSHPWKNRSWRNRINWTWMSTDEQLTLLASWFGSMWTDSVPCSFHQTVRFSRIFPPWWTGTHWNQPIPSLGCLFRCCSLNNAKVMNSDRY